MTENRQGKGEGALKQSAAPDTSRASVLRSARTIFIRSKSVYFKPELLENDLLKSAEFNRWGLTITREEMDADLIIEVGRKVFTTHFVFTVIDRRTQTLVASGTVNSLGGTVNAKIAKRFIKELRAVRPSP